MYIRGNDMTENRSKPFVLQLKHPVDQWPHDEKLREQLIFLQTSLQSSAQTPAMLTCSRVPLFLNCLPENQNSILRNYGVVILNKERYEVPISDVTNGYKDEKIRNRNVFIFLSQ